MNLQIECECPYCQKSIKIIVNIVINKEEKKPYFDMDLPEEAVLSWKWDKEHLNDKT